MKKILALCAAVALSVIVVIPASASTDGHGNVGTATGLSGIIPDGVISTMASTDMVGYTCGSVHEKIVTGIAASTGLPSLGVQDKQSCVLAAGSALPNKPTTYKPGDYYHLSWFTDSLPALWLSDYQWTANGVLWWADSWSYTISPSGALNITSFYSFTNDTCRVNADGSVPFCF